MTSTGAYPPGCTQRDVDEAQPGYWDPPQQEYECEHCDGTGYIPRRITVYEHGCGFPHDDVEEIKCEACGGYGGYVADVEPDAD